MKTDAKVSIAGLIVYPDHSRVHQQDWVMHTTGICRTIACGTHGATPHLLKILIENEETEAT